jgi:hypothetical protein
LTGGKADEVAFLQAQVRLSELLDEAQHRWPDVSDRKELLLRLAAEQTEGLLSGVYEPGDLERLREDWPA